MTDLNISREDRINLYKLAIARNDITEALFTTRLFLETVKSIRDPNFQPLQDAIVIAYARPFKRNRPYGSLDKRWEKFDSGIERLHELIIETRDTLVAHSDTLYRKVQIIPKGISNIPGIPTNEDIALIVSTKKIALDMFPRIEILCMDLGSRLNDEINDLLEKLFGNKQLPNEPFDLL
ncbi:hypothetical protein HYT18_02460 [Candidatus Microgenomates bacterium]|nr:hypothetical protein [Candidatus Microgenomates bacterium]